MKKIFFLLFFLFATASADNSQLCSYYLFSTIDVDALRFHDDLEPRSLFVYEVRQKGDPLSRFVLRSNLSPNTNIDFEIYAAAAVRQLSRGRVAPVKRLNSQRVADLKEQYGKYFGDTSSISIQPFLEGKTLQEYYNDHRGITDIGRLPEPIRTELADLLFSRILVGIPDNHAKNFIVNEGHVYSIDHAFLATAEPNQSSPIHFANTRIPEPNNGFRPKSLAGVELLAHRTSKAFRHRIKNLKIKDLEQIAEQSRFPMSPKVKEQLLNRLKALREVFKKVDLMSMK